MTFTRLAMAWRTRLAWRLALSFSVPAIAVAAISGGAVLAAMRDALRESAFERLRATTAVRERQFNRWVDEQANDLRFLVTIAAIRDAAVLDGRPHDPRADSVRAILRRAVETQHDFSRIVLLSAATGRVIASSESASAGESRADARYFREGRNGLFVQSLYPSLGTGAPALTIALPVLGAHAQPVGVMAGEINLDRLDSLVSDRGGLGRTGEVYLVDRSHDLVRGAGYDHRRFPAGVHTPTIDRALAGHSGSGIYTNYAGQSVIGVYRWLPTQQVALFSEMATEEAFAPAQRLAWIVLATRLLAALVLALVLTLVARQIARPIEEIAHTAQRIADGELSAIAPVRTQDEIGRLATAFNVMTARLHTLYGELETQLHGAERAAQAAEASRRLLRTVIDHLPALVAVKDLDGRYVVVNQGFAQLNGIAPEDALGRTAHDVIRGEQADDIARADRLVLSRDTGMTGEERRTIANEERIYLTSRFPLHDGDGRLFALGAVATDITERKRLEGQILHQQKLEAVGRLAGGVAHDINNLLTVVRCNAELLMDTMAESDVQRQHLEEIDRSVRNGVALTRQLLTFSRAHVVRPSALDLNRILGGMSAMLRRYVGLEVEIRFGLGEDLYLVHADEGQIEQVLLNLIRNAHDAMPGGGTVAVTTENVRVGPAGIALPNIPPGEYMRLSVSDTGTGIEAEALPLLFEPFFTTKDAGHGTGLGLSTAYAIVQQARGAITVDTVLGAGTTFAVYIPRYHEEPLEQMPSLPTATVTAAEANGETLLVVDDEPSVRSSLRRMLARQGYHVHEAESGHDAIAQYERNADSIALVLTDIFMPGMGGSELAAELRLRAPNLPIVFMSGYTADEVVRRGLMQPSTHFLQKPFERQALLKVLEERLRAG
jgi:PAS domain S-box-containing protein